VGISHCADKNRINNDCLPTHLVLQYRMNLANLINFQICIEFSHQSRIDLVASKHALPSIFLKYLINEAKRRDHDILPYNGPLYHYGLALNPS
jgi:hypothetical protein